MASEKKWTDYLTSDVYTRLCDCTTIRGDIAELTNAKWRLYQDKGMDKQGFTKEDALIAVLELLDSNSRFFDISSDEYYDLCGKRR